MADDQADKALKLALAHINKQFGANSIMMLSDSPQETEHIPTGALTLDKALGIGGVPVGRIVEIFGPESSGKSTLATHIVAEMQRMGGVCAYIDAEHALDPGYAADIGVKTDELLISQPSSAEEGLGIVDLLTKTGAVDLIVVDSVAALTPQAELDGDVGDAHVGRVPRLMAQTLRKVTANANVNKCTIIFINQIREKIGVMFGNPETTPGGRALKFYSSVRLDVRSIGRIKDKKDGSITGTRTRVKVIKNKVAPPFKEAEFTINYGRGIDLVDCIVELALEMGLITKSGSWFNVEGEQVQGRDSVAEHLSSDVELLRRLQDKIMG